MTNSMAIKKKDNIIKRATARVIFMWRNKRHFKMQTFGMSVLACVLIFVLNIIAINADYNRSIAEYKASTLVYTPAAHMSWTDDTLSVSAAYVDTTRTKAFLMLYNKNNMANIPIMADAYRVLVINDDNTKPKENITGSIHVIGTRGYICIYLESDIPFENNTKHLYVRSIKTATPPESPYVYYDGSDVKYNQCHLFFNFGATSSPTVDFLEEHQSGMAFDFQRVYRTVILSGEENNLRQKCYEAYQTMSKSMDSIEEYFSRVMETYTDVVFSQNDFPAYMLGDQFDYDSYGNPVKFRPYTLYPGGIDFDWASCTLAGGYYKNVPNTNGLTISEYLTAVNNSYAKVSTEFSPHIKYTDGREIPSSDTATTPYDKSVSRDVEAMCDAVSAYCQAKHDYQVKYLPGLLRLESDASGVGKLLSEFIDPKAIQCIGN